MELFADAENDNLFEFGSIPSMAIEYAAVDGGGGNWTRNVLIKRSSDFQDLAPGVTISKKVVNPILLIDEELSTSTAAFWTSAVRHTSAYVSDNKSTKWTDLNVPKYQQSFCSALLYARVTWKSQGRVEHIISSSTNRLYQNKEWKQHPVGADKSGGQVHAEQFVAGMLNQFFERLFNTKQVGWNDPADNWNWKTLAVEKDDFSFEARLSIGGTDKKCPTTFCPACTKTLSALDKKWGGKTTL